MRCVSVQKLCRRLAFFSLVLFFLFSYRYFNQVVPDQIRIVDGTEETPSLKVPVVGEVKAGNEDKVVPCGIPIGIYVQTDGVLAIGTGAITGMDGLEHEPAYNLIKSGDYIKTVNDEPVSNKEELIQKINQHGAEDVVDRKSVV
jgi:S1-C subfamily serine protease